MNKNSCNHTFRYYSGRTGRILSCNDWGGTTAKVYYEKTNSFHYCTFTLYKKSGYTRYLKAFSYPYHYDNTGMFSSREDLYITTKFTFIETLNCFKCTEIEPEKLPILKMDDVFVVNEGTIKSSLTGRLLRARVNLVR